MANLNMSVKHGQTFDDARANFEKGITAAEAKYGKHFREISWSDDRTSARLSGPGFEVNLRVDRESVHATGHVPFFVRMLEGPIRKFIQEALGSP